MESARKAAFGAPTIDTLCTLALAVLFYLFFDFTKHNAALAAVNPFVNDPYDAIGSFGTQAAAFAALLALVRLILLRRATATREQSVFWLLRAQMATVLLVLVTMVGNAVALARHTSLWLGTDAGVRLVALLLGLSVLATALLLRIHAEARSRQSPDQSDLGIRAFVVCIVATLVLALYPEDLIKDLVGALFTVVIGALLLFLPVRALLIALIRGEPDSTETVPPTRRGLLAFVSRRFQWILVVCVALLMGALVFLAEASGEGFAPTRVVGLAAVFVGLEATAVLIGFIALRGPLGIFRASSII